MSKAEKEEKEARASRPYLSDTNPNIQHKFKLDEEVTMSFGVIRPRIINARAIIRGAYFNADIPVYTVEIRDPDAQSDFITLSNVNEGILSATKEDGFTTPPK